MITNAKDGQIIRNGKEINSANPLPDVGTVIHNWMQLMTFNTICKKIIDGYTQEIKSETKTHAVRQPLSPQQISSKPPGQRSWKWEMLHALPDLIMELDDQVTYKGDTFRVQAKQNFPEYGYIEYHLVQDYDHMSEAPQYDN